jgi:hypothetical protein
MMRIKTGLQVITFCLLTMLSAGTFANPAYAVNAGVMEYDYNIHAPRFYDGTKWYGLNLGLPLGTCTEEGQMDFNMLLTTFQYCNGSNWIKVIGSLTLAVCTTKGQMDFNGSTFLVCNGLLWMDIKGSAMVV